MVKWGILIEKESSRRNNQPVRLCPRGSIEKLCRSERDRIEVEIEEANALKGTS